MSITSSGPYCDVCGKLIMPWDTMQVFKIHGCESMLHADAECENKLRVILPQKDWKLLPAGPMRKIFEDAEAALGGGAGKP